MTEVAEQISDLLGKLQSPDYFEREAAVKELGECSQDEAIAGLVIAMEDPDLGIRELAADQLTKIKGPTVSQLLVRFLAHDDIGTRNLASEILVRNGADSVDALIAAIENDDYDVRKFICDILGLIGDQRAIEVLRGRLWDENSNVVCSAAEALGEIGSTEAINDLKAVVDKIEDARLSAIEALGKIEHTDALDCLYNQVQTGDPMVQCVALEAIGMIGKPESIGNIADFLEKADAVTGQTAMSAIIDISLKNNDRIDIDLPLDSYSEFLFDGINKRNEAVTEFTLSRLTHWYGNNVLHSLLDVIDYVDEPYLKRITEILGDIGPSAAKPILEKMKTSSRGLKLKLMDVAKSIIDPDTAPALLPLVEDEDAEIRQKAAYLLGLSSYTPATATLKKLTTDPVGHVRSAAYSALGWLITEDDAAVIFAGLDDKYGDVREAAAGALIIVGGQKVVDQLTSDLFHDSLDRQKLAVTALGWIGEAEVVEPLTKALNHPDPSVRKSAIASLARIGEMEDFEPIVLALCDENSGVRKSAVSALVQLKGEECLSDIRPLLDDPDVWVRYHTITTIAELGNDEHAKFLLPYLEDDLDIIKIGAVKAVSTLGCRKAVGALQTLIDNKNKDLAGAAKLALARIGRDE